ncbi:hypothetical protein FNF31_05332 [Cafeteria roenbergensis]|uniref:Exonuclease domain-containing protein n=1 Tax=Cafeteria roenbergensis TaxID=33653 RepID=A0A5A8D3U4_CAFRO|nr:hypothetical protein FNF31_05332 [Cafeteria roenbergensis]
MADAAAWAAPANHKKKRRKQLTQSLNGHDAVGFPKPSQVEAVVSAVATDGQRSRGWDMVRPKVQLNAGKRRVADLQPDTIATLLLQSCGLAAKGTPPSLESRGSLPGVVLLLVSGGGDAAAAGAHSLSLTPSLSALTSLKLHCCKPKEPVDLADTVLYLSPALQSKLPPPVRAALQETGRVTDASLAASETVLSQRKGGAAAAAKAQAKSRKRAREEGREEEGQGPQWSMASRVAQALEAAQQAAETLAEEAAEAAEALKQAGLGSSGGSQQQQAGQPGGAAAAAAPSAASSSAGHAGTSDDAAAAAAAADPAAGSAAAARPSLELPSAADRTTVATAAKAAVPPGPLRPLAVQALRASDADGVAAGEPALGLSAALRRALCSWTQLMMIGAPLPAAARAALSAKGLSFAPSDGASADCHAETVDASAFASSAAAAADVAALCASGPEGTDLSVDAAAACGDAACLKALASPAAAAPGPGAAPLPAASAEAGALPLDRAALPVLAAAAARCPVLNVIGIDCEMVRTDEGTSLARVTVLGATGVPLLDRLVRPALPVRDFVTQYSGITPAMLAEDGPATDLETARGELVALLDALPCAVLAGHSLENDLRALKLVHTRLLDTSVLFEHRRGWPRRNKLSFLTQRHLGRSIQAASPAVGHCSSEDALASLELVLLRLWRGPAVAMPRASRSARADCAPLLSALSHPSLFGRTGIVGPPYFVNCYLDSAADGVACAGDDPDAVCRAVAKLARAHHTARRKADSPGASLVVGRVELPDLASYSRAAADGGANGGPIVVDVSGPRATALDGAVRGMLAAGALPEGTLVLVTMQASMAQLERAQAPAGGQRAADGRRHHSGVAATLARMREASPSEAPVPSAAPTESASASTPTSGPGSPPAEEPQQKRSRIPSSPALGDVCTARAWITVAGAGHQDSSSQSAATPAAAAAASAARQDGGKSGASPAGPAADARGAPASKRARPASEAPNQWSGVAGAAAGSGFGPADAAASPWK